VVEAELVLAAHPAQVETEAGDTLAAEQIRLEAEALAQAPAQEAEERDREQEAQRAAAERRLAKVEPRNGSLRRRCYMARRAGGGPGDWRIRRFGAANTPSQKKTSARC